MYKFSKIYTFCSVNSRFHVKIENADGEDMPPAESYFHLKTYNTYGHNETI